MTPHSRPACMAISSACVRRLLRAPPAASSRCRCWARASSRDSCRCCSVSNPAMRQTVATMRAADSLLLSIALRWLVTISTSVALDRDRRQVGRVLHQPGNIGTHGEHAVMQGGQQVHRRAGRRPLAITFLRALDFLHADLQAGSKPPRSALYSSSSFATSVFSFARRAASSTTTADASRGIAFCALPPLMSATSSRQLCPSRSATCRPECAPRCRGPDECRRRSGRPSGRNLDAIARCSPWRAAVRSCGAQSS